jgi:hypothetical protein
MAPGRRRRRICVAHHPARLKAIRVDDTSDAKATDAGEDDAGRTKPSPTRGKTQASKPGGGKKSRRTAAKGKTHWPRAESKQATVIAMLSGVKGATIPTITLATGWQQHSVRGFFAGVVRKKLGLNLVSEKTDGDRAYRIVDRVASPKRKGNLGRKAA